MHRSNFAKSAENVTVRLLLCVVLKNGNTLSNTARTGFPAVEIRRIHHSYLKLLFRTVFYFSINCIEGQWNFLGKFHLSLILNSGTVISVYTYNNSSYHSVWTSIMSISTGKGWPTSPGEKGKNVPLPKKGRRVESSLCLWLVWAVIWFSAKESACQSSEMMSNLKLIVNCIWLIGKVVSWSWGNQHWAYRALSPANRSCSCSKFNKMADLSVHKRAQAWQSNPMQTLHWSIIGCFVSPVTCSWPVSMHSEPLQMTACALYTAIWFYWTVITVPSFCVELLCTY